MRASEPMPELTERRKSAWFRYAGGLVQAELDRVEKMSGGRENELSADTMRYINALVSCIDGNGLFSHLADDDATWTVALRREKNRINEYVEENATLESTALARRRKLSWFQYSGCIMHAELDRLEQLYGNELSVDTIHYIEGLVSYMRLADAADGLFAHLTGGDAAWTAALAQEKKNLNEYVRQHAVLHLAHPPRHAPGECAECSARERAGAQHAARERNVMRHVAAECGSRAHGANPYVLR